MILGRPSTGSSIEATPRGLTRALLWCGVIAGPLFIGVFLVEGMRAGYDPVSMTVSQLATGADGWTQTLNFVATGALVVAFALGTRRAIGGSARGSVAGPAVLALFGLGIIGAGVFATDPGGGYPPGVAAPAVESLHSTMHDLVSLVVFLSLPVTCLVFAARFAALGDRRWGIGSAAVGIVLGGVLVALLAGHFGTVEVGRISGVIQRGWIALGWGWVAALGVHLLRGGTSIGRSQLEAG